MMVVCAIAMAATSNAACAAAQSALIGNNYESFKEGVGCLASFCTVTFPVTPAGKIILVN